MMRLGFLLALAATPALADPEDYRHMMDWGYGYGHGYGMLFGPILWIIVLGLVVAGVIWLVRGLDGQAQRPNRSGALAELDLRFARGEIEPEDYAARKKLLNG